jgi:hypothetical protein
MTQLSLSRIEKEQLGRAMLSLGINTCKEEESERVSGLDLRRMAARRFRDAAGQRKWNLA